MVPLEATTAGGTLHLKAGLLQVRSLVKDRILPADGRRRCQFFRGFQAAFERIIGSAGIVSTRRLRYILMLK